jgi:hypothetical protein
MSLLDVAFLEVITDYVVHPRIERQLKILLSSAQHPETGVPLKNRTYHLKKFFSFYGHELVEWIAKKHNTNNEIAVRIAQMMQKRNMITTVGTGKWINDDQSLYQFQEDDETTVSTGGFSLEPPASPRKRANSAIERIQSQRSSKRLSFSFKTGFSFQEASPPSPSSPKLALSLGTLDTSDFSRRTRTPSPIVMGGLAIQIPEDEEVVSPLSLTGSATITITGM